MKPSPSDARNLFESYLRGEIVSNREQGLLRSESEVSERLLARGEELEHVYQEVYDQLHRDEIAWKGLLQVLVSTGAFWSPARLAESRDDREELVALNRQIARQSQALAEMLIAREERQDRSAFSASTHYDICAVIAEASAGNGRFEGYVKEPLEQLSGRFDLKYWPSLADCVRVIGLDAECARVSAVDPLTEAATKSTRASNADFVRALREAMKDRIGSYSGGLPKWFRLSHAALATLVNIMLDLPEKDVVGADYVKNVFQRDRLARVVGGRRRLGSRGQRE